MAKHQNLSSPYAIHPFAFSSNADPASDGSIDMAPYKGWINTGNSNLLKVRNAANGAWEDVSVAGAATAPAFGSNSASVTTYNDNAGTLAAAQAHHHIGVTSLAHTSNTFSGPVTVVAGANIGITSPTPGTYRIDGSAAAGGGAASAAAFVGCRAYNNGAQTLGGATETTVTFGAEEYDTDAIHDTGSNTGRMTVPSGKDGKWRFWYHLYMVSNPGVYYAYLRKNGTTAITGSEYDGNESGNATAIGSATIVLAAADYIEVRCYRAGAGDIGAATGGASNVFEAEFIGA